MERKVSGFLLILGLLSAVIASRGVSSPGYMDADYYYAMGLQWAKGKGAEEPFIWQYLSDPEGIPTSSHTYWLPLSAITSGIGLSLFGQDFRSAQIPFILATALLPFLVWRLALTFGLDHRQAIYAGLIAMAPGFFLPFFVTTDGFSLLTLLGALLMLTLQHSLEHPRPYHWVIAGVLCGLAHLGRADGFLLLLLPVVFLLRETNGLVKRSGLLISGYVLVMLPWFYCNQILFGSLLGSGSGRALWMLTYDELFQFPGALLNFERWSNAGIAQILLHRWLALKVVLQRILAENGMVLLTPFILIGLYRKRGEPMVQGITAYFFALFLLMVLVFPFAGARGGWFHSSTVMMPLFWVMVPVGLEWGIGWLGDQRHWDIPKARNVFGIALVLLTFLLTWGLYAFRVLGFGGSGWNAASSRYASVHEALLEYDPSPAVVAINNPPGFFHLTGVKAVVIPNGDEKTLREVVDKYQVTWVVIDRNHSAGLDDLYDRVTIPDWLTFEGGIEESGEMFFFFRVKDRES